MYERPGVFTGGAGVEWDLASHAKWKYVDDLSGEYLVVAYDLDNMSTGLFKSDGAKVARQGFSSGVH